MFLGLGATFLACFGGRFPIGIPNISGNTHYLVADTYEINGQTIESNTQFSSYMDPFIADISSDQTFKGKFSFTQNQINYDILTFDLAEDYIHTYDSDNFYLSVKFHQNFSIDANFILDISGIVYNSDDGTYYYVSNPCHINFALGYGQVTQLDCVIPQDIMSFNDYEDGFLHLCLHFHVTAFDEDTYNAYKGITSDSYQQGYNNGKEQGYNEGKIDGYNDFRNTDEYQNDIDNAYESGKNHGYYEGLHTQTYTFTQLFGAIADTPIMILSNLLGFDVFGVSALSIVMTMLTGCIVFYLIKRIIL